MQGKKSLNYTQHGDRVTLVLWHQGGIGDIASKCRQNYPKTNVWRLGPTTIKSEVKLMHKLRNELHALGAGGSFGTFREMTSGAHAILMLIKLCDNISLYGMSTYTDNGGGPDQYGGRSKKTASGRVFHDWKAEQMVWRYLHAAGKVTICST